MSEISEFADRHIFPAVYEKADQIFPEFGFKEKSNHWVSTNKLKIDGTEGESIGKVYIYRDRPYGIKDYRSKMIAIPKYLQDRGICSSYIDAIKHLARQVDVQLPNQNLSKETVELINQKDRQATLFETINDFFITSLLEEGGYDANALREYLEKRGYSDHLPKSHDEIHSNSKMELGFYPSREKLKKYLKKQGIESEIIDSLFVDTGCFYMTAYGTAYQLAMPYRDHMGRITGFIFRNINYKKSDSLPKYLCSTGLSRKETLFKLSPLKGKTKDLTIVEGYPDVMLLKARGIDNITALGGVSLNHEQALLMKKMGAESITLWLDMDEAGISSTDRAIEVINKSDLTIKVYVVEIPNKFKAKDPDELIRDYGIEAYHEVIKGARRWYIYQLDKILNQIKDPVTDKNRDQALNEINKLALRIDNPIDREAYCKHIIENGAVLGVSAEALQKAMDKLRYEADKERHSALIQKGVKQAQHLLETGQQEEAIELLGNIGKQKNTVILESSYQKLLTPTTEAEFRTALKARPDHLSSGLKINSEDLFLPSGAISIVAAPTSHGKTSFLINIGLNVATDITTIQSNRSVYLFSYEESREAIILKTLNTYIDKNLSHNNRRSIESCIKEDTDKYINHEHRSLFSQKKDQFFNEIIKTGRLHIIYSDYSSNDLIGAIHYICKHGKPALILIDYIQLLEFENNPLSSRQGELKEICIGLKDCAIETKLPMVLGAQFNRTVTEMAKIHPTAIGEAGDIERIANLIVGLWNKQFPDLGDENHKPEPYLYAKILKGRDIAAGSEENFHFDGNTGKISNNVAIYNPLAARQSTVTPLSSKEYREAKDGR